MDPHVQILDLLEEAEDPFAIVGIDPRSGIHDPDLHLGPAPGHLDGHRRVRWRELQPVRHELAEDPPPEDRAEGCRERTAIGNHPNPGVRRGHFLGQGSNVHFLRHPRVDRELEPFDQPGEGLRALDDPVREFLTLGERVVGLGQGLGHSQDDGDRRAELVGEPRHQLVPSCGPLDECSVVTAPYEIDGRVIGTLGVIGPTRMAYERVIPIVDVTAKLLSNALTLQMND